MNLLILSSEKQFEVDRILEEARKRKHHAEFMKLSAKTSPKTAEFDAVLFRAIEGHVGKAESIAKKFSDQGKTIVDEKIAKNIDRNKMQNYELFEKSRLYVPPTEYFTRKNKGKILAFDSDYIVLKPVHGKRGRGIRRIRKNMVEAHLRKTRGKQCIAQEFAEIKKEYRVYVVGYRAIGAMEKVSDSWIHNIYQGAKPRKTRLPRKVKTAAIKASRTVQTEIAGVDIGLTDKGLFIIEVNRSPGFRAFESLGNNFAEKVLGYVEKKNSQNTRTKK